MRRRPLLHHYRRRPWHSRPSIRLAVVAALAFAAVGAFALLRDRDEATDPGILVAASTIAPDGSTTPAPATETPAQATETPARTASPDSTSADPSPAGAGEATGTPSATASPTPAGAASAPATPTAPTTPTAPATSTATPVPEPTIELRPAQVGHGEAMLVRVEALNAETASVQFEGSSFPLARLPAPIPPVDGVLDPPPDQPSVFWGVVGVPISTEPHSGTLTVEIHADSGDIIATASSGYEVVNVDRPVDYLELTEELTSVLTPEASAEESRKRAEQFAQFDPLPRWEGLFLRPVGGVITTQFGQGRSINGGPVGGFHSGADLALAEGTPVRAAAAARVAWTGEMPIRGFSVILDHGGGVKTGYHHLSAIEVAVGDLVPRGSIVGQVGSTGLSTGPHLHWELTIWGVNVDPLTWTLETFTP